jgi:hypothetical protein
MKNKKLIIGVLLSVIVISGASAYDPADKAKCLSNPDKVVWIESRGSCIPINPCTNSRFENYCVRLFKDIQVDKKDAADLVDRYARHNKISCQSNLYNLDGKLLGQDYIPCSGYGDDYLVFEFDDISESDVALATLDYYRGVCLAHNGTIRDSGYRDWKTSYDNETAVFVYCYGIPEDDCFGQLSTPGGGSYQEGKAGHVYDHCYMSNDLG